MTFPPMRTPGFVPIAPWFVTGLLLLTSAGCATAPPSHAGKQDLKLDAVDALRKMEASDPSLASFLQGSAGYVVFPHVGKGGYIVGGSYGRGVVYRAGGTIGYADITQATVGFQFGGESYMEVLAFETDQDVDRFTTGRLAFAANLSAVILKTGAAASAQYTDGVAIFAKPIGGAMVEAAVGGQQFTFVPE
jgi:lipid-binding SYLF domain-containing protein